MLDLHLLREKPDFVAAQLLRRGIHFDVKAFQTLETKRKSLQIQVEQLQNTRNTQSKAIGFAKAKGEATEALQKEVVALTTKMEKEKAALDKVLAEIQAMVEVLPNLPHASVPDGKDEKDNVEVRKVGTPRQFDFTPLSHDVLGAKLGQMDFSAAANIAGSRFVVLKKDIAKLHRVLTQWMLDVQVKEHGYTEAYVPCLVNAESMYGAGKLPKFEADLFKMQGEPGYYLIPTGEVPLINLYRDKIIEMDDLPVRLVAHTPCFRSEAGSYGKDTKGMIRQHQFEKVELVWITTPEQSYEALEQIVKHAEVILQRLELPYRVVNLCTGDLGDAAKTYDLEVWLPSQNTYREISSCSNLESFQARRMQMRYRDKTSGKPQYVHTLNGSGLAVGRALVALLENYQTAEGEYLVPEVLRSYL